MKGRKFSHCILLLVILCAAMLMSNISVYAQASCQSSVSVGGFTVTFNGTTTSGNLVTFHYEVCNVSASRGLSHWVLDLLDDCITCDALSGSPTPTECGPAGGGDPCATPGFKWDNLSLERGECQNFSLTVDTSLLPSGYTVGVGAVPFALKYGTFCSFGEICGPVCEVACEIECEIDAPEVAGVLTGTVSGGTAPYSCTATVAGTGWSVDACDVDDDGSILVTYSVEHPADCDGVFTVTITDANGCETTCEMTVRCVSSCEVSPGASALCDGDEDGETFCVTPVGGVGPFTYSWTGPEGFTADTDCITVSTPGVYTVTITDGNGFTSPPCCAVLGVVTIDGPDELCTFLDGEYCANVDFGDGVDTSGLTYSWSVSGSGTINGADDGPCVTITADGSSGFFSLSVTVSGSVSYDCGESAAEAFVEETSCEKIVTVETCGCTPGYWKNHPADWGPTGYSPGQTVGSVFTSAAPYAGNTLMQALNFAGGSGINGAKQILLRAAVAALLNASHPNVGYGCLGNDPNAVIAFVNTALASGSRGTILTAATFLDNCNNAQDCPLDDH